MIEVVVWSLVAMLGGILLWETAKFLWSSYKSHAPTESKIRRDCDHYENKTFRKDMKELRKQWEERYGTFPQPKQVEELVIEPEQVMTEES